MSTSSSLVSSVVLSTFYSLVSSVVLLTSSSLVSTVVLSTSSSLVSSVVVDISDFPPVPTNADEENGRRANVKLHSKRVKKMLT